MKKIYFFALILLFVGCGRGSTTTNSTIVKGVDNSSSPTPTVSESEPDTTDSSVSSIPTSETGDKQGKAQLGVISNATIKLYLLNGANQRLLATETTSKGDSIRSIGNFNLHLELLDDNEFYLYQVSGGTDWDVNDDGQIDNYHTKNLGNFQLIAKGSDIKKTQQIRITVVSAIIYKLIKPYLGREDISNRLLSFSKQVIQKDINGDGTIDMGDIFSYDPIESKSKLFAIYQNKISDMINNILNGKEVDFEQTVETIAYVSSPSTNYPTTELGVQDALDHGDYSYVINQLKSNRDAYGEMSNDKVSMNIAGAYVGLSGYTVFDITGAIAVGNNNNNSLNGFIHDITKENNALDTLESLEKADKYYSEVVKGINCSDTTDLTEEQKASCFNLGLIRLTTLSNSVKLLFGGDEELVKNWADGVDINSSDDLNGNSVADGSDASACAIVYANNPQDNCRDGSMFTYRGRVSFNRLGVIHNTTLLEIDVGSTTHGFSSFYKLTTNNQSNNSVVLTNGVCDKNLNMTTNSIDGVEYFPCPTFDKDGALMTIADSLALSANVQGLFPNGSDTRDTANGYIQNITGSADGVIDQNNLSNYLQRH